MGLLKRWFKTIERPKKVQSKWNSTLNRNLIVESVIRLVQNQWEAKKSPFKMEFYTEPRSQCGICDYGWFKTCERPKKVHSKWNSALNRDLSVESVTTASSKPVKGRKKFIQNGTELWSHCGTNFLWLTLLKLLLLLLLFFIIYRYNYHYYNC